ncbi:arabinan endo-1,5-alpha-L-arabinosidase [Telmatobacter bradus]|uniref:arabinan endo-1,5-alpha-L-arabinosidase n=1 Tax=Telmatobacter bradus TaxID=474953 RepID=UPI003B42F1BD
MFLRKIFLTCGAALLAFALLRGGAYAQSEEGAHAFTLTGDYQGVHDPSIIKAGDTWYVFTTGLAPHGHMAIRCSKDLEQWKFCGQVLNEIPAWIHKQSPGTKELWAPDISYFNGKYHLYYAYSLFGVNTSGIALLTNKTLDASSLDYKWVDEGLVLRSTAKDDFNAIDPNLIFDADGKTWLAFGSFWSGIKMRRINSATGKLSDEDTHTYALASRAKPAGSVWARRDLPPDWQAVEAPFVIHHGSYYYLFVSWDLCCRGTSSTYHIVVGRAKNVTGPYVDAEGKNLLDGGGLQLLAGNRRWLGPGGQSLFADAQQTIMVFHAYDAISGKPAMQLSTVGWKDDWPVIAMQDATQAGK